MKPEKTDFTQNLVCINELKFNKWIFEPGMLFRSETKWWGNKGTRDNKHNGLDLSLYETHEGIHKSINADTKVPIMYKGKIVRCIEDFLGYTIFAAHEIHEGDSQLFTLYGHVKKTADHLIGKFFNKGEVISSLSEPANKKIPPHLHISIALIPKAIPADDLSWKLLDNAKNVVFFDPIHIV